MGKNIRCIDGGYPTDLFLAFTRQFSESLVVVRVSLFLINERLEYEVTRISQMVGSFVSINDSVFKKETLLDARLPRVESVQKIVHFVTSSHASVLKRVRGLLT